MELYLDVPIVRLEQPYEKDDKASIVGPSSYKEHGFRMLMIWASGLNPDVPLIKELCEALSAVDKKAVAGTYINTLFHCYRSSDCYFNKLLIVRNKNISLFTRITMDYSATDVYRDNNNT